MTASLPSLPSPPSLLITSSMNNLTVSSSSKNDYAIAVMNLPPFLRLPAELRNRIYELVVGVVNKRIHIRQLRPVGGEKAQEWCQDLACCGLLYSGRSKAVEYCVTKHAVCCLPGLTDNTVVLSRSSEEGEGTASLRTLPPRDIINDEPELDRHDFCIKSLQLTNEDVEMKVGQVSGLLGACRQIYEEASSILYGGNTFSFKSPREAKQFARHVLGEKQRATIKKIHLSDWAVASKEVVESVLKDFPGWESVEVEYKQEGTDES